MVLKTKRVDAKHVIVLDDTGWNDHLLDLSKFDIYLAKRLVSGGLDKIPDEEPTIVFRGRDRLALKMMLYYRVLCIEDGATDHQLESLDAMIHAFEEFSLSYPDRMKQPGITRGR